MVSSMSRDLPLHREQVRLACERNGFEPRWMMEHLTALNEDPVQASLRMVEEADVYLGILAYRYGTIPSGYNLSITEMEYNRAAELKKPRLVFFIRKDHPVVEADFDTGPGAEKLKALKARIGEERVAAFFKSPAELYGYVGDALRNLAWTSIRLRRARPQPLPKRGRRRPLCRCHIRESRTSRRSGERWRSGKGI
jgi:hypothetical protein